jgi:hypothetical protein
MTLNRQLTDNDDLGTAVTTCRLLWPGYQVHAGEGRAGRSEAVREFLVVPNHGPPRLLLPAAHRRAAARIVAGVNTGVGARGRLLRIALAGASLVGAMDRWAPRRLLIDAAGSDLTGETIEGELRRVTGEDLTVTFSLGTARANQKPVLTALGSSGRARFFVKIGHNPLTKSLVAREAESLRTVSGQPTSTFTAPRCVHHGSWNDVDLLVMTALPSARLVGWQTAKLPLPAMRDVARLGEIRIAGLQGSDFWRDLSSLEGILPSPGRDELEHALAVTRDIHGWTAVRLASWHGDWTPDNMARHRRQLLLWDWERFQVGVPLGFDVAHYCFQATRYKRDWAAARAVLDTQLPATLRDFGVPADQVQLTIVLYLATIAARYLHDAHVLNRDSLPIATSQTLSALAHHVRAL